MDLVLRTTLDHFCHGATSGDPGSGRPTELTEQLGTTSRKDTESPCHLFLPESLVAQRTRILDAMFSPLRLFFAGL